MPNGSLPRMTPAQRKRANALIRKICCNYDDGNCLMLDDGEECVCVQSISYSVNCKMFRHVLLKDDEGRSLEAEIFRDNTTKRCSVCGRAFQSTSNNAPNTAQIAQVMFSGSKRLSISAKRGRM